MSLLIVTTILMFVVGACGNTETNISTPPPPQATPEPIPENKPSSATEPLESPGLEGGADSEPDPEPPPSLEDIAEITDSALREGRMYTADEIRDILTYYSTNHYDSSSPLGAFCWAHFETLRSGVLGGIGSDLLEELKRLESGSTARTDESTESTETDAPSILDGADDAAGPTGIVDDSSNYQLDYDLIEGLEFVSESKIRNVALEASLPSHYREYVKAFFDLVDELAAKDGRFPPDFYYGEILGELPGQESLPAHDVDFCKPYEIQYAQVGLTTPEPPRSTSPITTTTTAVAPSTPRRVTLTVGHAALTLRWATPASDGGAAVVGYRIEYRASGRSWVSSATLGADVFTHTVTNLSNGTTYELRIAAINGVGVGAYTTPISGTPTLPSSSTPST